jgi:hypothetical protein
LTRIEMVPSLCIAVLRCRYAREPSLDLRRPVRVWGCSI